MNDDDGEIATSRAKVGADSLGLSDRELALAFVEDFGGDAFRYLSEWDRWYRWTGAYWERLETLDTFDLIGTMNAKIAARRNKPRVQEMLQSARKVSAIERFVKADRRMGVAPGVWDRHPYLLNTPAGTIDLEHRDLQLRPHDPQGHADADNGRRSGGVGRLPTVLEVPERHL